MTAKAIQLCEFFGPQVILVRKDGKKIALIHEHDPERLITRHFAKEDGGGCTELMIPIFKLEDGDTISCGEGSTARLRDLTGSSLTTHLDIVMCENSKLKLHSKGKRISKVKLLKGLFRVMVDTSSFNIVLESPHMLLKFPTKTAAFLLDACCDVDYIFQTMPYQIHITNRTTKDVFETSIYQATRGSTIIARADGFYRKKFETVSLPKSTPGLTRLKLTCVLPSSLSVRMKALLIRAEAIKTLADMPADFFMKKVNAEKEELFSTGADIGTCEDDEFRASCEEILKHNTGMPEGLKALARAQLDDSGRKKAALIVAQGADKLKAYYLKILESKKSEYDAMRDLLGNKVPKYEPFGPLDRLVIKDVKTISLTVDDLTRLGPESEALIDAKVKKELSREKGHLSQYTAKSRLDNKRINYNGLAFGLKYAERGPSLEYGMPAPESKEFLLIGVEVRNDTKDHKFFFPTEELRLVCGAGEQAKQYNFYGDESYEPGGHYNCYVIFVVPDTCEKFVIQFGKKSGEKKNVAIRI